MLPSIAAGTIPAGVRPVVAVHDPQPIGRFVVAVTPPERSPSALALLGARREEAALIAETTLHFLDA